MPHRLRWLGHGSWELTTSGGKIVLIDPWIVKNPKAPIKMEDLRGDYILITHDHFDHASESPEAARQSGAVVIAQVETANKYQAKGIPEERVLGMNMWGTLELDGFQATMTDAYHSSESGDPAGFILTMEDGRRIWFLGDTAIHRNFATWAELYPIDVAVVPTGGRFTMDSYQAAHALTMIQPRVAIPGHFGTFPILEQTADAFVRLAREKAPATEVVVLEPGQTYDW